MFHANQHLLALVVLEGTKRDVRGLQGTPNIMRTHIDTINAIKYPIHAIHKPSNAVNQQMNAMSNNKNTIN